MPWDRDYYYRSQRLAGKPRRIYVGKGAVGRIAEAEDVANRERKHQLAAQLQVEKEAWQHLTTRVAQLAELTDGLVEAAMFLAGYQRHHRTWRRRRDHE